MKRKKLIPLSQLLDDECLGDIAKYSHCIYIDIKTLSNNNIENGNHNKTITKL